MLTFTLIGFAYTCFMKILSYTLLICLLITIGCKEEESPMVQQDEYTGCLIKTLKEGDLTTTFEYEGSVLIRAIDNFGDTNAMVYNSQGLLTQIKAKESSANFHYKGDEVELIRRFDFGTYSNLYKLSYTDGFVSRVESYLPNDTLRAVQILSLEEDSTGVISSMFLDILDPNSGNYLRFIEAVNIELDGKKNPFNEHIAFVYLNIDNPFAYGPSNVVDATLTVLGFPSTMETNYNYNERDYPLEADIDIPDGDRHMFFTYLCF